MTNLAYLKYKLLKFRFFILLNFGKDEHGGFQFLRFHIIPKKNVKNNYVLNQFYNTHEILSVGSYFALLDGRDVLL